MLARLHTSIASTRNGGTLPCGDHDRDVSIANPWRQLPSQLSMPVASGDTTIHHIRTMSLPLQICGTGHYLPERIVRSDELDLTWQRPAGTTERELGIRQRHVAGAHESSSFMAARAAERALAAAGLVCGDIDAIISACAVPEQAIPCLAVLVQREMGLGESGIPAFDVNSTCLSFITALDVVSGLIACGRYGRVLIVSSEIASAGLDPQDPYTAGMFGDGAAAVVVQRSPQGSGSALLASHFETYSKDAAHCRVEGGGTRLRPGLDGAAWLHGSYFRMDGHALYKRAAHYLPDFLARLLGRAGLDMTALDCVVPHQASHLALKHLIPRLGLPAEKVINIFADHGNQVAASLPLALDAAVRGGAIRRGQRMLLLGTGAGVALGGVVLEY